MSESNFLLDYEKLSWLGDELRATYQANTPFPHIVIDQFLPEYSLQRLQKEYPTDQSLPAWNEASYKDKVSGEFVQKNKRNIRDIIQMPPAYRQIIWELNSAPFLGFLSRLISIDNLIPDPNLRGAGIHQTGHDGYLKVHVDFTYHRDFGLDRRTNFLLYLNDEWNPDWGGQLELWDPEMKGPPKCVMPIANRCVIFTTTASSYHGHPRPLCGPPEVFRKSLALYYYTNGRPEGEAEPVFSTDWKDVPY
ncbi:conserved hypothetical protein [gamma proteobacterium HdN1]|nr:conserved hypothetical protein [gamma proteobacterium HdN1]